jgi:hypothetical protein
MENLPRHTDLFCELETSFLMRGIQMEEMSKLGWLFSRIPDDGKSPEAQLCVRLCVQYSYKDIDE